MNVGINSELNTNKVQTANNTQKQETAEGAKFADELSNLAKNEIEEPVEKIEEPIQNVEEPVEKIETPREESEQPQNSVDIKPETEIKNDKAENLLAQNNKYENNVEEPQIDVVLNGLQNTVEEMNIKLNTANDKLNRTDDKSFIGLKENKVSDDKLFENEDNGLINNDMNVQELKEALAFQMNANMNFDSNGQQFSDFMNEASNKQKVVSSKAEIAEENAILSTMDENIAMANRNRIKTVTNNEGVKKVDTQSNITVETVVKFDEVLVSKTDVEFFSKVVENGSAEITQETVKSAQVSKTLADMIAKSMKDNQPIRINFDNDISVIIRISRDGKISADFLPSSQIAEAYLKENLPILKQRFDDNNIEYDSLNQRKQRQDEKDNQKKGRRDE